MIIFQREIEGKIRANLFKKQIVTILGPRQSGKTTLSKKIINDFKSEGAYFNCELASVRKYFVLGEPDKLLELIGTKKIVVFDEAQTIENIGKILKVFFDTYTNTQIIATGSSSFDLSNKIKEPLTGRVRNFTLLPLSVREIREAMPLTKEKSFELLQFGSYPAVVSAENKEEKINILSGIATNYLYKDIFIFEDIRNPMIFENLLKMLALQIGNTVSTNELAQSIGVSRETIQKYLRLLEQSFVIKVINSFSRNKRNEIKKSYKVIFLDIGIRNAIIDQLSDIKDRSDKGALWENFFISERMKAGTLEIFPQQMYFWRTRSGLEIDLIEEKSQKISAYECKWKNTDFSFKTFLKYYPNAITNVITPEIFFKE